MAAAWMGKASSGLSSPCPLQEGSGQRVTCVGGGDALAGLPAGRMQPLEKKTLENKIKQKNKQINLWGRKQRGMEGVQGQLVGTCCRLDGVPWEWGGGWWGMSAGAPRVCLYVPAKGAWLSSPAHCTLTDRNTSCTLPVCACCCSDAQAAVHPEDTWGSCHGSASLVGPGHPAQAHMKQRS